MSETADCALVTTAVADLRARPAHQAELVSQRWLGEALRVLAWRRQWARVAGFDGYPGWVRTWSLMRVAEHEARAWQRAAHVVVAPGVQARVAGGERQPLPWGAQVVESGRRGDRVRIVLPDGRPARVAAEALRRRRGRGVHAVLDTVRAVLGTPYLWGGTTPAGFDCSGLMQWAFALCGLPLPRDADQQYRALPRVRRMSGRVFGCSGLALRGTNRFPGCVSSGSSRAAPSGGLRRFWPGSVLPARRSCRRCCCATTIRLRPRRSTVSAAQRETLGLRRS